MTAEPPEYRAAAARYERMSPTLLGLEPVPGGWHIHAVDPEEVSTTRRPSRALCRADIGIRPLVEVQAVTDLHCRSCVEVWLGRYAAWLRRWRPELGGRLTPPG